MKDKPLSRKHQLFVAEYLSNGLNATQAYLAVYNCEYDAASVNGHGLLRNTKIKEAINQKIKEKLGEKDEIIYRTIEELKKIAFSDVSDYVQYDNDSFKVYPSAERDTRAIESVKVKRIKTLQNAEGEDVADLEHIEFKLHDKKGAIDSLMRYLGLYTDKVEVDLTIKEIEEKKKEIKEFFKGIADSE